MLVFLKYLTSNKIYFLKDLNNDSNFYFTHSYGVKQIKNKNNYEYNIAYSKHSTNFISAINYKKICGVQLITLKKVNQ